MCIIRYSRWYDSYDPKFNEKEVARIIVGVKAPHVNRDVNPGRGTLYAVGVF